MSETFAASSGVGVGGAAGYMQGLVNSATGRIIIDASQPQTVPGIMQGVAQGINSAMGQVNAGTIQATNSLNSLASAARQVAGAFGIGFGIQGIKQLGEMAIEATNLATAYNRQLVAARSLAGSQTELNHLLAVYQEASGGAVDKATALANVNKLMAVGFADNAQELQKFTTVIRGISIAMGQSQDYVTQNLILELFSQRGARLDQLGLEYDKVKQRADQLAAADSNLTARQAYQNAVLEQAQQKFGALADSQAGQKTGLEKAGASAKDFGLLIGEFVGPTVNAVGDDVARTFDRWNAGLQAGIDLITEFVHGVQAIDRAIGLLPAKKAAGVSAWMTGVSAVTSSPLGPDTHAQADAIRLDWAKGIKEQTQQVNDQITQANADFLDQKAKSESDYQKASLDAAQDFGRQRLRENQDLNDSIARINRDSAQREAQQAADLARSVAEATNNSEDKIADARKDAAKQILELDTNYEKERVKRAKDLSDQLLDAAGNLDAKQVFELQRNAARQEEEAKEAHDDQRKKIQEQLDERIDDERKSLAKSIAQQKESYDRQLQQSRDADAQRIQDMKDDLKKRQDQEDTDYDIRMERLARDHDEQLAEMDRVHNDRITQIQKQGDADLAALADQHKRQIDELQDHHSKYNAELKKADDATLSEFTRLTNPVRVWMGGPQLPLVTPNMAGTGALRSVPFANGNSYNNSSTFNPTVNVNISGGSNLTQKQIDDAVHDALIRVYQEIAK